MSKKSVVAASIILVVIAGATAAYDRGAGVLAIVLIGVVVAAGTVAAIDTNQRVRSQQRGLNRWRKSFDRRLAVVEDEVVRRGAHVSAATQDDVLGTVKLMQEQYVGRLDRVQAELEQATARLRRAAPPE